MKKAFIAEPLGSRWVSWSRTPGSGGSYMIRPASVGEIATITRRPRATSPPRQCTVTLSAACSISCTGTRERCGRRCSAANRFGISLVPPTNRVVWAPPSDSANSSDGHAAGLNREQQMQERHLGGRHREDADRADLQQGAGHRAKPLRVVPGARGDRVPLGGPRRLPGRVDRERRPPTRRGGAAPARVPSAPRRSGRETRSPATPRSRPARRTSRPRRTADRSRRRVRPPAGTSADVCRRSTGRRARPERPGTSSVRIRPPTRSSASRISGVSPASCTFRAAIIPERPAPTMMTSASWL